MTAGIKAWRQPSCL